MRVRVCLGVGIIGVLAGLVGPAAAWAERLFVPVAGLSSRAPGIARVQELALDAAALASVRARDAATLTAFPLGADGTVTLAVDRFEPFTDGATAVVMKAGGPRALALPDQRYYRGTVAGDPGSLALVVLGADTARGFVARGGTIYRFGRDRGGVHRSWALRDADPAVFPDPGSFCDNERLGDQLRRHAGRTGILDGGAASAPPTGAYAPTLLAQVAIDTDQELLAKFPNEVSALAYLADLAAAVSTIYAAETDVLVKFSFIRLWDTTDPWTASSTGGQLGQLRSYWIANETGTPRDVAHLVSGRPVAGGVAYIDTLCDPAYGYGVSQVYGSFDVMDPDDTWDVVVVAHELGHNFGSEHTHCYSPPVDGCYNGEPGCYAGPESLPPGGGTIMSYCHLLPGGMSNVNLQFGATVADVMRGVAESGICIGTPCGDGELDPGEQCDDGNDVNGDCCSASCAAEPDGGACDDGEVCTGGDQCAAGTCAGSPVANGTPCDDASLCTADTCQAGACVGTPAPAALCRLPIQPGGSQLQVKDKSPDRSDQLVWKWGRGADTTLADLGDPSTTDAYELCLYGPGPDLVLASRIPAGETCAGSPCWRVLAGKGFAYRDKERTPSGIEKLSLKAGTDGAAKITLKGKGELLDPPVPGSLTLPIDVQLRRAGQCWGATFSSAILSNGEQLKAKSD